jgi:hypothetical protein
MTGEAPHPSLGISSKVRESLRFMSTKVRRDTLATFAPYDLLLWNYNDGKSAGSYWDEGKISLPVESVLEGNDLDERTSRRAALAKEPANVH